jgi:hypothetical protein
VLPKANKKSGTFVGPRRAFLHRQPRLDRPWLGTDSYNKRRLHPTHVSPRDSLLDSARPPRLTCDSQPPAAILSHNHSELVLHCTPLALSTIYLRPPSHSSQSTKQQKINKNAEASVSLCDTCSVLKLPRRDLLQARAKRKVSGQSYPPRSHWFTMGKVTQKFPCSWSSLTQLP